jgi:hypothetical protein
LFIAFIGFTAIGQKAKPVGRPLVKGKVWSVERANKWYSEHQWMTGANFIPSTAINQLEMWQAETFDPTTIYKELGYAEGIGFNTMRVFLHSVAYGFDPNGFKSRVNQYLTIANKHHIQTMYFLMTAGTPTLNQANNRFLNPGSTTPGGYRIRV